MQHILNQLIKGKYIMNEKTKSLIRHILTALGFVLGLVGLNKFTGVIDYLIQNLDTIWAAVLTLVGIVTSIFGFFKDRPANWKG